MRLHYLCISGINTFHFIRKAVNAMCLKRRIKRYLVSGSSCSGFTLLELLISLVMIGVISLIITDAIRLGVRSVNTGEKKIDSLERTRASFNIIESQIQSQLPLTFEEKGEKKYYFQGDRDSLQFPTNYSIWGGRKGFVMVKYRVQSDEAGKLSLSVSENIMGTSVASESRLFTSADAISFEYFFRDPAEEKGRWFEKWTDTVNIPEKVKLNYISGEKDISLIIPTRTAGSLSLTSLIQAGPGMGRPGIRQKPGKP